MKRLTFVLLLCAPLAGCAANSELLAQLEREQQRQSRLLAEQNELVAEQSALLSQMVESQQQMVEMSSDVDETLKSIRARADQLVRMQDDDESGEPAPAPERRIVVNDDGKVVMGRIEWAWLDLLERNLKARIDTGALSSSLNAVELQPFERDGQRWIRFRVPDEDHLDGGEFYETRLLRYVRIRQASAEELERRPVVRLTVRVGELVDDTEFTLTNRENMMYPMLLGRGFMRDVAVVDVARKFVQDKQAFEQREQEAAGSAAAVGAE